jgi:hypothetical protein
MTRIQTDLPTDLQTDLGATQQPRHKAGACDRREEAD